MNVTLAVALGRTAAAYRLSEALDQQYYLGRLITSYPKFALRHFLTSTDKILSLWPLEVMDRGIRRTPLLRDILPANYWKIVTFDALASRSLGDPDIFCGYSSFSLASIRAAKRWGVTTVLLRGSTHIVQQAAILREEYKAHRLSPTLPDIRIMDREVAEYHEADYIIVSSSMARRTFIEQGVPEGKVMVVPEGVDTLRFHAKQKSDTVFRPIFVGHIGFRKGVLYLLEAIRKLRLKNCKVWLIGSIEEAIKPFLAQYDDLFTHVGSMAQENLDKYYSEASVFVLPSVEDGWGLVTGEAMSCGLPVVVSANAGSAEMVRDGVDGFITPARDVQLLAEKLLYLYEHEEERRTMGAAARERATQFTWEQYGQRMIETFHMILGKSPNNSS